MAIWSCLEYKDKIPRKFVIELVKNGQTWLNAYPPKSGVSEKLALWAILTGVKMDSNLHFKIPFGYYAQVY